MREKAVLFGHTTPLVGIVTYPPAPESQEHLPAILLLNSGLVHRVGLNRLHVKIARQLAAMGFVVFRFDFSGLGDSPARTDVLPFRESAICETQEAMDFLQTHSGVKHFILMGICSGAILAFKTACSDPRVAGAVLINAVGHLHGTNDELGAYLRKRSLLRHYWRIAFSSSFRWKNWRKALIGRVDYQRFGEMVKGFRLWTLFARKSISTVDTSKELSSLIDRGVHLLHIYSEGDEGLDYFQLIQNKEVHKGFLDTLLQTAIIRGANHTFTPLWSQEQLLKIIQDWMQTIRKEI